ncbi:MAG: exosortase/archaeosortase family protein, partial [Myxococcota bacterium]
MLRHSLNTALAVLATRRAAISIGLAAALYAFWNLLFYQPRRLLPDPLDAWFFEANETSPQLVYLLFAWVLWHRRDRLRTALSPLPIAERRGQVTAGGLVLALGAALYAWASYLAQLDLLFDALIISMIGAGLMLGGVRLLKVFALPLVVLWLARPLPPVLTNQLHWILQIATGESTYRLISLFGAPVFRSGDVIWLGERIFEVIETCSGLRMIQTLITASLLYSELFSTHRLQTLAVVLSAPLIGFFVNGLRVVTLVLNPFSEVGAVHSLQGIAMLMGGVLLLTVVDRCAIWALGDRLTGRGTRQHPLTNRVGGPSVGNGLGGLRAVSGVAVALALLSISVETAAPASPSRWHISEIPRELAAWKGESVPVDFTFMGSVRFDEYFLREYRRGEEVVRVFV